jgi:hypothetical protein
MNRYTTVLFKDDNNRFYIGNLESDRITKFNYVDGIDLEVNSDELLLVDVETEDKNIKITPLVKASIANESGQNEKLYLLDHDTLLEVVNDALSSAERVSRAEAKRERRTKKKSTKKK